MELSQIKSVLKEVGTIGFQLPNGELVPNHFHVTEIGNITKKFIDCGGTVRTEEVVNLQLWNANDHDHRLHPKKLLTIIERSEKVLGLKNEEIEVEYQGSTIQKFGLDFDGVNFLLTNKQTDCLAKEKCGIPLEKVEISTIGDETCCSPDGNCC